MFTLLGFGSWRDDRLGETLVFAHAFGQFDAANLAHTTLVCTPCTATQVAAHNHLYGITLAENTCRHHRIGHGQFPVGTNVGGLVQEFGCYLVENLTFERNALG